LETLALRPTRALKIRQIRYTEADGLGSQIRTARVKFCKSSGRTLESICEEVGTFRSFWYNIENEQLAGDGALQFRMLLRIQEVLGADFGISEADLREENREQE
jgi:hypothetical protein